MTTARIPIGERFEGKYLAEPNSGCWLWMASLYRNGYGQIGAGGSGAPIPAHRVSWEIHNGPIPDGSFVLHKCDVRSCVNPAHLFLGTAADNAADREAKGRGAQCRGERSGKAKLTSLDVIAIRAATGLHRDIAALFNVSKITIGQIKARKRWAHVE